jgi:DNA sulfur modification protein DndD
MVLRRITLHNFLTYSGDQSIDFPEGRSSTLTIVVGPNNSGKTSLIRGLKFWFYGEKGLPSGASAVSLLSNRAKAEVEIGGSLSGWVEVAFERDSTNGKEIHIIRRLIEGKRVAASRWETRELKLKFSPGGRLPKWFDDEGGKYQRMLEAMVPRALFDAFYFKGEPLDGKLLGDVTSIRDALGQFLHEDQWREAERATTEICEDLSRKLAKLSAANKDLSRKVAEQRQHSEQLTEQRQALEQEHRAMGKIRTEYDATTQELSEIGDESVALQLKARLHKARQRHEEARAAVGSADLRLQQEIGVSLGLPFLTTAIQPVATMLKAMEDDNILPADITSGFVDRVLQNKKCICGKVHDQDSRTHWEAYRERTLAADAGDGLRKLMDWVKPTGVLSVTRRAGQTREEIIRQLELRKSAVATMNEAAAEVAAIEREASEVPIERIAEVGRRLRQLSQQLDAGPRRLKVFEDAVRVSESVLKRLKEEVGELSRKTGVDQQALEQLTTAQDRSERLLIALKACRERLGAYFHRVLQRSVAEFYDTVATDGSRASIDRQSLLPAILIKGTKTSSLGGGQSQLLALAYVVSLARLRQNMHSELEQLGVSLGKVDDLSFFMDSPFGNMEEHYKTAAITLVPNSAQQVVLLLWREEWDFARKPLEAKADSIAAIRFNTTAEDVKKITDANRTYSFATGKLKLVQALPSGDEQPYSELLKIT